MRFKNENIRYYSLSDGNSAIDVCPNCVQNDDELTTDSIVLDQNVDEEEIIFCDRCGGRLQ